MLTGNTSGIGIMPSLNFSKLRDWACLCFLCLFLSISFGITPSLILAGLGVILSFLTISPKKLNEFIRTKWLLPCLAIIAIHWIGLFYSSDTNGLGLKFALKTYYWLFAFALVLILAKESDAEYLILAFLIGIFINAIIGIFQFLGLLPPKYNWYSGLGSGYNNLTLYLVLGMLTCSYCYKISTKKILKYFSIIFAATYFFHLTILEGRTGYFVFLISLPIIVNNFIGKKNLKMALCFAFPVILLFSLSPIVQKRALLTFNQLRYHLNGPSDKVWGKEYTANQDRFYMWYGALELFLKNPIIGVGTGGYGSALKTIRPSNDPFIAHPHNSFLYILVSFGLLGFGFYIWFFLNLFKISWPKRNSLVYSFIIYSLLVLLLGGFFNSTFLDSGSLLLFSLTVGMCKNYDTGDLR